MLNATCCGSPQNSKIECMRVHEKSQKYRYRNLISQIFRDGQIYIDVGATTGFGFAKMVVIFGLHTV